jgi:hypothetical protein
MLGGKDFLGLDLTQQTAKVNELKETFMTLGDHSALQHLNMVTKSLGQQDGSLKLLVTDYSAYKQMVASAGQATAMATLKTQALTIAQQALNAVISMGIALFVN